MINAKEYYPIGSIVLLKGALKKAMIIGIIQNVTDKSGKITEYDYIGVIYPEGYLNPQTLFMFNHDSITDVVFKGYENIERSNFINKLEENMEKFM